MLNTEGTPVQMRRLSYYIEACQKSTDFHKSNADSALQWHNLISILSVVITGSQALVMTIMGVQKSDEAALAITGASFALLGAVLNRVSSSFNFNVIAVLHNSAADDYNELLQEFNQLDSEVADIALYKQHVKRFISVVEKSHTQPVKKCYIMSCLCCF